jgi:SAM-dependent methyltransferase
MNSEEIKQAVKEHYGKVATEKSGCCESSCGCGAGAVDVMTTSMSDTYEGQDKAILDAADYGLGCGTPTLFAGLEAGMSVLDLGSGAGIDVFIAAKAVSPTGNVIGIDMTDEMLERAEENKKKLGIMNAEFRKGEIENLPVESGSIDRVLSNCVINLVPDKEKAFAEIYRVLKQGGRFTISDIVTVGVIPEKEQMNTDLWCACVSGALEKDTYLSIIAKAGFKNISVTGIKQYPGYSTNSFRVLSITVSAEK